jgi:hypothetical protein
LHRAEDGQRVVRKDTQKARHFQQVGVLQIGDDTVPPRRGGDVQQVVAVDADRAVICEAELGRQRRRPRSIRADAVRRPGFARAPGRSTADMEPACTLPGPFSVTAIPASRAIALKNGLRSVDWPDVAHV